MGSFLLLSDQFYGIQIVSFRSSMKLIAASDCTALGRDPGQCSRTYLVLRPLLSLVAYNSITTMLFMGQLYVAIALPEINNRWY